MGAVGRGSRSRFANNAATGASSSGAIHWGGKQRSHTLGR